MDAPKTFCYGFKNIYDDDDDNVDNDEVMRMSALMIVMMMMMLIMFLKNVSQKILLHLQDQNSVSALLPFLLRCFFYTTELFLLCCRLEAHLLLFLLRVVKLASTNSLLE